MKLIIAGGRDYRFTDEDWDAIERIRSEIGVTEVVCGGACGADEYGRQWAISNGISVKMFPADWKAHGKAAGPIRNWQMAEYADAAALFPGGKGTDSMFRIATDLKLTVFDFRSHTTPELFAFDSP